MFIAEIQIQCHLSETEGIKVLEQTHKYANCFSDEENLLNMVDQILMSLFDEF